MTLAGNRNWTAAGVTAGAGAGAGGGGRSGTHRQSLLDMSVAVAEEPFRPEAPLLPPLEAPAGDTAANFSWGKTHRQHTVSHTASANRQTKYSGRYATGGNVHRARLSRLSSGPDTV